MQGFLPPPLPPKNRGATKTLDGLSHGLALERDRKPVSTEPWLLEAYWRKIKTKVQVRQRFKSKIGDAVSSLSWQKIRAARRTFQLLETFSGKRWKTHFPHSKLPQLLSRPTQSSQECNKSIQITHPQRIYFIPRSYHGSQITHGKADGLSPASPIHSSKLSLSPYRPGTLWRDSSWQTITFFKLDPNKSGLVILLL